MTWFDVVIGMLGFFFGGCFCGVAWAKIRLLKKLNDISFSVLGSGEVSDVSVNAIGIPDLGNRVNYRRGALDTVDHIKKWSGFNR